MAIVIFCGPTRIDGHTVSCPKPIALFFTKIPSPDLSYLSATNVGEDKIFIVSHAVTQDLSRMQKCKNILRKNGLSTSDRGIIYSGGTIILGGNTPRLGLNVVIILLLTGMQTISLLKYSDVDDEVNFSTFRLTFRVGNSLGRRFAP